VSRFVNERRHERFESDLTIKLHHGEGAVRNVSAGGIYFVTDVPLQDGQTLNFTLEFHDSPSGPIAATCTARIVRLESQGARYGVAASISSLEFHRIPKGGPH
jgi:hypothetical protein